MSKYRLRPHHALCLQFFSGHGYSSEFTDNMVKMISFLKENPQVEIASAADDLCRSCPNLIGSDCKDCKDVGEKDRRVCIECGFSYGDIITAEKFFKTAYNRIIADGKLREVCGVCQWSDICTAEAATKKHGEK